MSSKAIYKWHLAAIDQPGILPIGVEILNKEKTLTKQERHLDAIHSFILSSESFNQTSKETERNDNSTKSSSISWNDIKNIIMPENKITKLASYILSNNLLRSRVFSHKKHNAKKIQVAQLNDHIDLYDMQKIDVFDAKYEVDHIFEIQCMAYVVACALSNFKSNDDGRELFEKVRNRLVQVINSHCNLNVTDRKTNLVKMNVFREFIKLKCSNPDCNIPIKYFLNSSNFDKSVDNFGQILKKACKGVRSELEDYIENIEESHLTTKNEKIIKHALVRILEEFDIFVEWFKIK